MEYSVCPVLDGFNDDVPRYNERLPKEQSKYLFTQAEDISVDLIEYTQSEPAEQATVRTVTKDQDLDKHLRPLDNNGHRFFILKPSEPTQVSACELHISEDMAYKLLGHFGVIPGFIDFLSAFGTFPNITFGDCQRRLGFSTTGAVSSFEVAYNFKSAIPRPGRPAPHNWSLRQTAVYHKFTHEGRKNVWILVQPEDCVRKRVAESPKYSGQHQNPLLHHLIFLSAAAENWGAYLKELEQEFNDITINAVEKNVGPMATKTAKMAGIGDPRDQLEISFRDLQELQLFQERVQMVHAALDINQEAIYSLKALNTDLWTFAPDQNQAAKVAWHCVDSSIEQRLSELSRHKRNIEGLFGRIRGRTGLLYNVLEYQTSIKLSESEEKKEEARELARQDRERERDEARQERVKRENEQFIARLERQETIKSTEKAVRDTVGMKLMTIVALLYLPSTFVATLLNCGIMSFEPDDSAGVNFKRLKYSKESLIFFFAFAIPLTLFTVGTWYYLDRRYRKRARVARGDVENALPRSVDTALLGGARLGPKS